MSSTNHPMTTEVELKYLILSEDVSKHIHQLLNEHNISFENHIKTLNNCYFDTPDLKLRKLDMGLRVRSQESHIEQTIKTAGKVVGGMHQRPEYNVNINGKFPELALFPNDIWPSNTEVNSLQSEIISLFNTNFVRETWLVTISDSVIELAYDQGEISADGRSCEINEVELELVSGDVETLYSLAKLLFQALSMRAGIHSKAARGYRLFFNSTVEYIPEPLLTSSDGNDTIIDLFINGIAHYLEQLQQSIDSYLNSADINELAQIVDTLSVIRHGLWLFDPKLSDNIREIRSELSHFMQLFAWVDNAIYLRELMNKTGNYRKKLEYSAQLIAQLKIEKRRFPDFELVKELLHSERFNDFQLKLLQIAISEKGEGAITSAGSSLTLTNFAEQKLTNSLQELHSAMAKITNDQVEGFLEQRKILHRCLLTGNWFGYLFEQQRRFQFRVPWLDMQQGLRELQSLWIIKQQLEKLAIEPTKDMEKIITWQQRKVENLMTALCHTKEAALSMPAYWLK